MSAPVLCFKVVLVAVFLVIEANCQVVELYERQSPFSTETYNPSISRAIRTNKLRPSADYWGGVKSATSPTNYARQNQDPISNRQPKHYLDSRHQSENLKAPAKPGHRPREPLYKAYDGYRDDYNQQVSLSKSKYEVHADQEVSYQAHRQANYASYSKPEYRDRESYQAIKVPAKYANQDYSIPKLFSSGYSYNGTRLYCNPEAPPACFDYRFGMCVQDESYPEDDVRVALEHFMVRNRLPDPLVVLHDEPTTPTPAHLLIPDEPSPGACPSSGVRITPIRVKNTDGRWRVIVQRYGEVVQRESIVVCDRPESQCYAPDGRNEVSLQVSPLARSCFRYYCSQLKAVKRYLAFDPCNPGRGLFVDSFPMPSACSCRLSRVIC